MRQSESRFRSLTENATETITVVDVAGVIQYQSPSVETMLGYTAAELTNWSVFALLQIDEAEALRALLAEIVAGPGQLRQTVIRIQHKDGSERWLQVTGKNLLQDAAVGGVVLNMRDITKERQSLTALAESEQSFRTMARGAGWLITALRSMERRGSSWVTSVPA